MNWRKSSYSGQAGGNCVEVGQTRDCVILVRDTKDADTGPVYQFTVGEWRAFIEQVKAGRVDS